MCEYIKDNGEQCGRTTDPFCHDHEDTVQAKMYRQQPDLVDDSAGSTRIDMADVYAAVNGSSSIEMDTTCDDCETALRRTERLTDHENLGGQMMFVALVECDCSEHILGTQPVRVNDLPEGWT
jgi:hypothetical protein